MVIVYIIRVIKMNNNYKFVNIFDISTNINHNEKDSTYCFLDLINNTKRC